MDGLALASLAAAALLYALGLRRVRASGAPFQGSRVAWFYAGIAALLVALGPPMHGLAEETFLAHMAQHLLLVLVAPPMLALGAPITLALRASTPRVRTRVLVPLLRSPAARFLSNPIVGWVLLIGVSFGVHVTPIFDQALRSGVVHGAEHIVWLTAALIYWWPIVGRDPSPHRISFPVRMLSLFLAMPAMSFLALAIYSATVPLAPTYAALNPSNALADQQSAAVLMWLFGNVLLTVAILAVAIAWKHHDTERSAVSTG
ncbi:MAG: cytochrome c oxidase assembly protein [Actinomycetota bacterium]